jgi:four helix bundle protein
MFSTRRRPQSTVKEGMAMGFSFEQLNVYQRALKVAETISGMTAAFGRGHYILADELRRSAYRTCQQIAEGAGHWPRAEQRGAYSMARGVVLEMVPLLELARRASLLPLEMHESLKSELEGISKMLNGLIRGSDEKNGVEGLKRSSTVGGSGKATP